MDHVVDQSFQAGFFGVCTHQTVQVQSVMRILCQDRMNQLSTKESGSTCQQDISAILWSDGVSTCWRDGRIKVTFLFQIDCFGSTFGTGQCAAYIISNTGHRRI